MVDFLSDRKRNLFITPMLVIIVIDVQNHLNTNLKSSSGGARRPLVLWRGQPAGSKTRSPPGKSRPPPEDR